MTHPHKKPVLYIFSGLPATGKSTLAKMLSQKNNSLYLRIDTLEQALRDLCSLKVQGEGYRICYRIASDNLKLGMNVVADSCNPWKLTRDEWEKVALDSNTGFINIQVVCSDTQEHRCRAEFREIEIDNLRRPTWENIQNRDYHEWHKKVVTIDTAFKTVQESFDELVKLIEKIDFID